MVTRNSLPRHIVDPPILAEKGHFLVKLADNHEEIEKAQRLRFEIFNLEQGRGLRGLQRYGIDFDEFDEHCLHILVIEKDSGRVIGTYRAHLGAIANTAKGFYSSRQYDIRGIYGIADKCLELGRSCVSPEFRSGTVVALLWRAISEILVRAKLIYMLGCVSLDETDPRIGWALYEYFRKNGIICNNISARPRPGFRLERPPERDIERELSNETALKRHIPPILKGYLRLGALICGEPALDEEFGTIDFFIFVDAASAPERYRKHFHYTKDTD